MKKKSEKELRKLPADGKIAYLIKPILKVLQDAGGQLERSEIKERIADIDDQIAEYAEEVKLSKRTGNSYKEFNFKFNFAIKDLLFNGLVTFTHSSPVVLRRRGEVYLHRSAVQHRFGLRALRRQEIMDATFVEQ